jgi:outer membrane protein
MKAVWYGGLALVAVVGSLWSVPPARAADAAPPGVFSPAPSSTWTVTLGAEGRAEPLFPGARRDVFMPYPLVDVRRAGTPERFHGPRDGIGFGVIEGSNFQIGPVGQLKRARNESDDSVLRGLGDVPWAVEAGIFAEYWSLPWLRARGEARQGFNGHHGVVSNLMVDAVVPVTPQLTLSGGPRLTLESSKALSPYFGITPEQSAASGLPVFDPKGGLYSVGVGSQARYWWTPQIATHAFVEYERLTEDAAHSPLVTQRGSANQWTLGIGATRAFDVPWFW